VPELSTLPCRRQYQQVRWHHLVPTSKKKRKTTLDWAIIAP
jgi:hypothetical protein